MTTDCVELNPAFRDYEERTSKVDGVLRELRKDRGIIALKGWRDEVRSQLLCAYLRLE